MRTYIYAILFALTASTGFAQNLSNQKATVVWVKGDCNYSILEYDGWFHVAEKINAASRINKGDVIQGIIFAQNTSNYTNLVTNEKFFLKVDKRYKSKIKALDDVARRKKCTITKEDYAQ